MMEDWEIKICLRLSQEKRFQELMDAFVRILEPYSNLLESLPEEQSAIIKCYQRIMAEIERYQTSMAYQIGKEDS